MTFRQLRWPLSLLALLQVAAAQDSQQLRIVGVGTTAPLPVYLQWFQAFEVLHPDLRIDYIPSGSETGMDLVAAGSADFGATDIPLSEQQLAKTNASQIATLVLALVPVYNLPELTQPLKFSAQALAGIYLGTIIRWNDPAIAIPNPQIHLPSSRINVIHSADGRGSTYIWSDYLSKVSPEWRAKVGKGMKIEWPAGHTAEGNGNVAKIVNATPNSIGYVELVYATRTHLPFGEVQNAAGKFVGADSFSITAAATTAKNMAPDVRASLTNPPGEESYPIVSFTWILLSEKADSFAKHEAVKDFLRWALSDGQTYAEPNGLTRLPKAIAEQELSALDRIP